MAYDCRQALIMIEIRNLDKRYGDGTRALNGISARLNRKITSIIGQNGAGKTTLLRILSTQLMPTSGSASVNGYDVIKDASKIRNFIVSIPQEARPIDWITVLSYVRGYLTARGIGIRETRGIAESAIKQVGLWDERDKLCSELSGGMKRRIFLAIAIASNAEVVFLDEPTTGLDPLSRFRVWHAIRALKGQVILTTHYMEEAQALSDEVLMINRGRILSQGTVKELLSGFDGMMRVEGKRKREGAYRIGGVYISYIKKREAAALVMKGDIVRPVSLDDLFIKEGVNLES